MDMDIHVLDASTHGALILVLLCRKTDFHRDMVLSSRNTESLCITVKCFIICITKSGCLSIDFRIVNNLIISWLKSWYIP